MAKYAFIYHGGSMPETPEEGEKVMAAWMAWMQGMGGVLVDGGNPFGKSKTVLANGSVADNGGANPASGYTLIEVGSENDAIKHAKNCPILAAGGSVEICEVLKM